MLNITFHPCTPAERLYAYPQSSQLNGQTGCIGRMIGNFGEDGTDFITSWDYYSESLKTNEFVKEQNKVLEIMRFSSRFMCALMNERSLIQFCRNHKEFDFYKEGTEYGFRADTEQYSYFVRFRPHLSQYGFRISCYRKDMLDRHMKKAENGIRFINPDYEELFRIPDGDHIRLIYENGTGVDHVCRYIDDTHMEIGSVYSRLYHICELAEQTNANNIKVIPMRSSLPLFCYAISPSDGSPILIEKGVPGYREAHLSDCLSEEQYPTAIENLNRGISKAQVAAMLAGSVLGWENPAADPANYNEQGESIRPR